jgi:Helix-turn-helix domain
VAVTTVVVLCGAIRRKKLLEAASCYVADELDLDVGHAQTLRRQCHGTVAGRHVTGGVCLGLNVRGALVEAVQPLRDVLRLEAARFMLEQGRLSVETIARSNGFGDRERMRRSFLRAYGQTPQSIRNASRPLMSI